ncbi:hypothetical protein P2G88_14635 [Aliiglaciecola sp. CAU 1673]|uniref:hypothetical protein n=1 Tax=Aliiglaciecola sp. CAU 1673 TaxID=3032595 RepID=UPI0023DC0572|nr:hypothetical protein [Aliiglaciecola sp. CAU 1673]MDF2179488.1 hypothetical protein [Aliiglaciecola sp. CAU 1673]
MKAKNLIVIAMLLTPSFASAGLQQAISAFEAGKDAQAKTLFEAEQDSAQAKLYLSRLWMFQDLDKAEDLIEQAMKLAPEDPQIHFVRGQVMGRQASNSILSAFSYAKKSLQSFQRAVELSPDTVEYRQGLMGFYLQAPGIAGGDPKLAFEQVEVIKQLDAMAGVFAELDYLAATDNEQAYKDLMLKAQSDYAQRPEVHFKAGMALVQKEIFTDAMAQFKQAITKETVDEDAIRARLNALYQLGRSAVLSETGLQDGIAALDEYLAWEGKTFRGLPSKDWANFRRANLYQLLNQKQQAKDIYLALSKVADEDLAGRSKKKLKKL